MQLWTTRHSRPTCCDNNGTTRRHSGGACLFAVFGVAMICAACSGLQTSRGRSELITIEFREGVSALEVIQMFIPVDRVTVSKESLSRTQLQEIMVPAGYYVYSNQKEMLSVVLASAGLRVEFGAEDSHRLTVLLK